MKILLRLKEENLGTGEFIANQFLSTLHDDLGTLRRALVDLFNCGYATESNLYWPEQKADFVTSKIDTRGTLGPEAKKSSRLNDPNDIPPIRLVITLTGLRFLVEAENLRRTTFLIKHDLWIKSGVLILGAVLGFFLSIAKEVLLEDRKETVQAPLQAPPQQPQQVDDALHTATVHDTTQANASTAEKEKEK